MKWQSPYTDNRILMEILQISHMRLLSSSPLSSQLHPQWQHYHSTVSGTMKKKNAYHRREEIKPHLLKVKSSWLFYSGCSDKTILWIYKKYRLQENSRNVIYWLCYPTGFSLKITRFSTVISSYSALKIFPVILDPWFLLQILVGSCLDCGCLPYQSPKSRKRGVVCKLMITISIISSQCWCPGSPEGGIKYLQYRIKSECCKFTTKDDLLL